MPVTNAKRAGRRQLSSWWALGLAIALLAGCGGAGATAAKPTEIPPTATVAANATVAAGQTATAVAFGTANALRLAAMLTPAPATPTPSPAPTGTPAPTGDLGSTPTPQPGGNRVAGGPTPVATPYLADFATWAATVVAGPNPGRTSFDPATGRYAIALNDATRYEVVRVYPPQPLQMLDYTLDVDIQRITGPKNGGSYGVLFRVQPQKPGDKALTEYVLWLYPDVGAFALNLLNADGTGKGVSPYTKSSVIQTGDGVNHVRVLAESNKVTLNLNGTSFGPYQATLVAPGTIGLVVQNAPQPAGPVGMEAAFSHLTVRPLPGH